MQTNVEIAVLRTSVKSQMVMSCPELGKSRQVDSRE